MTLHLGDCLDPVSGLASLADRSVDHVICDPPYEAEAHTLQRRVKRGGVAVSDGSDSRVACVEALSFPPITGDERAAFAVGAARVASRWVIAFCQAEAVQAWRSAFEDAGLSYRRAGIWVKPDAQPQLTGDRPGMGYESIVFAHVKGRSKWNGGGKVGVYVFNKNEQAAKSHPTQKPLSLMEALVRDFTDPGELVCDPFAGSGTTGVACRRLGRRFIGWERDPVFHAAALKRLEATREQLTIPLARAKKPKQAVML